MIASSMVPQAGDGLIIVDVQNDFLPGGALAVPNGDAVVTVINEYISIFQHAGLAVFATRDWHPADHCSFKAQGGVWPPHCLAGTYGAEFSKNLHLPQDTMIISKATEKEIESYSGFNNTSLDQDLTNAGLKRLFICGLATDYCVLNTVKDAIQFGYDVFLLEDAIKPVNLHPDDGQKALDEMLQLGAVSITLSQIQ